MGYRRNATKPGPSMNKWAESLLLGGGIPAILIPFFGFYIAWIQIRKSKEYAECKVLMEGAENKDDLKDFTRFIIGINQVLMYLFVVCYFTLYTKPRRTKRQIRLVSIFMPLLWIISVLVGLMNFMLYGASHCNDKSYGMAALISTIALLLITVITMVVSLIVFCKYSGTDNKSRVTHAEERDSLV